MGKAEWYAQIRKATGSTIYLTNFYKKDDHYTLGAWVEWNKDQPAPFAYDHRTVLTNEVVFDIDTQDWNEVKRLALLLTNFLSLKGIPYIMGQSGGKGVHIHVFLKLAHDFLNSINFFVSDDRLDLPREIRLAFFEWVSKNVNIDMHSSILDRSLVSWSSNSKGHMVREFGGRKFVQVNGQWEVHYKTFIQSVPDSRVWVLSENDVAYPIEIPYYRITGDSIFGSILLSRLKQESDRLQNTPDFNIDVELPDLDYIKLPCIKEMLSRQIPHGNRNMVGKVLSAVCMKNSSFEKCEALLKKWHDKYYGSTDFKFREVESWLRTFEKKPKRELFFSCGENLRLIGENESFCRNKNCPVYVRRNELRG
ncbi:MAG: hypothetical protein ACP5T9_05300 [Thermoplasmata archaeon]